MSDLESTLEYQLKLCGLDFCAREFRFHPKHKWRFDFAWYDHKLAVECEGGVYSSGRHTRGKGFEADIEKYNTATLMGWRVLRFTAKDIKSGMAVIRIAEALAVIGAI